MSLAGAVAVECHGLLVLVHDDRLALDVGKLVGYRRRYSRLILSDAEKGLGAHDRMGIMGDDYELAGLREVLEDIKEEADVPVIKRRVELIEYTERRWLHLISREKEGDCGHGPLSA